jgi:hypothetical protein
MDVQVVFLSTSAAVVWARRVPGVSLSTARGMDERGVSISTASSIDIHGVSLSTSVNIQGVSQSISYSVDLQGTYTFFTFVICFLNSEMLD